MRTPSSPVPGLLASLVFLLSCQSSVPGLIPIERLMGAVEVLEPALSPDGLLISYMAPVNGVMNLWVMTADDPRSAKPITHEKDRGLAAYDVSGNRFYRWSGTGKYLIYGKDKNGDENWNLFAVDVATGVERALTPFPGSQVRLLGVSRGAPDELLVGINNRNPRWHDLYRVGVETGKLTLIETNDRFVGYVVDRSLRPRIAVAVTPQGGIQLLRGPGSGQWTLYRDLPPNEPAGTTLGFDSTNAVIYAYNSIGRNTAALVSIDLATGRETVVAQNDTVDVSRALVHPTSGKVQAYATNFTRYRWAAIDSTVRADLEYLAKAAPGDLNIADRSLDDRRWLVDVVSDSAPQSFYLYDRAAKRAMRLFSTSPSLDSLPGARLHPFVLRTKDGLDLVSYYAVPPGADPKGDGQPTQRLPTVVIVHGGPSDERAQFGYFPLLQWLTNRGYAVLLVNFRGSPGFGKAFLNAQRLEWGGKMHQDVLDQVSWAVTQGIADKSRVAIFGGSYGGYETLVAMTMSPDVFACGLDVVGPANLLTFMTTIPAYWSLDHFAKIVGDPRTEEGRAHLKARSPITYVNQVSHPLLIAQGANDVRVPQAESDSMVAALTRHGVKVTYLLFPDEGHGFRRTANSLAYYAVAEQFLKGCLGGRARPIDPALVAASSMETLTGAERVEGLAKTMAARPPKQKRAIAVDTTVTTAVLQRHAGVYEMKGFKISVVNEGPKLFLDVPGQPRGQLLPTSETEFASAIADARITFRRDATGHTIKLILHTPDGQDIEGTKIK